jgi:hypothetical protein
MATRKKNLGKRKFTQRKIKKGGGNGFFSKFLDFIRSLFRSKKNYSNVDELDGEFRRFSESSNVGTTFLFDFDENKQNGGKKGRKRRGKKPKGKNKTQKKKAWN